MRSVVVLATCALAIAAVEEAPSSTVEPLQETVCKVGKTCSTGDKHISAHAYAGTNSLKYHWPRRGNHDGSSSTTSIAPSNFSSGWAWTWPNPWDELVRHSPVIDDEFNIYIVTGNGYVRKFNHLGKMIWSWRSLPQEGKVPSSACLYKGTIFVYSIGEGGIVHALDMRTGRRHWQKHLPAGGAIAPDSSNIFVHNDTLILPRRDHPDERSVFDGNNQVVALKSTDGSHLWTFQTDVPVWNLMPASPGDGTIIFANQCGQVYRLNMHTGELIWKSGLKNPGPFCSTSGGTLGPNGVFYVETNQKEDSGGRSGIVVAIQVDDGQILWSRRFGPAYGGWQAPGVGRLTPNGRLAVFAAVGGITGFPSTFRGPSAMFKVLYHHMYLRWSWVRRLHGTQSLPNAVVALDAETGDDIWRWEEKPWDYELGAGDGEGLLHRMSGQPFDPQRHEVLCIPDNMGIPTIGGNGVVYASSSHSGDLYAIRDANRNGIIEDNEVNVFETGQCFLNGPSLAPGMLVVAPCWGPVYVFKNW